MNKKGKIFVITGPSAVGKDSIVNSFIKKNGGKVIVSATSRSPRKNEKEGVNYYFLTKEEFEEKIKDNELLEYTIYNNNYYGTPKYAIDEYINKGINVFLVIEVEGALNVKRLMPESTLIFIMPPSLEELKHRIEKRGIDSKEDITRRLDIANFEISQRDKFDYIFVNDEIDNVVNELEKIV